MGPCEGNNNQIRLQRARAVYPLLKTDKMLLQLLLLLLRRLGRTPPGKSSAAAAEGAKPLACWSNRALVNPAVRKQQHLETVLNQRLLQGQCLRVSRADRTFRVRFAAECAMAIFDQSLRMALLLVNGAIHVANIFPSANP